MAKSKKTQNSLPNKNIHLRLSFLHEAALYLTTSGSSPSAEVPKSNNRASERKSPIRPDVSTSACSSHLISHMRGVSRRSVIRLDQNVKRSVCKGCDQLLLTEESTLVNTENKSKNQSKPWADVRVVKCRRCGTSKRFPCRKKSEEHQFKVTGGASEIHQSARRTDP